MTLHLLRFEMRKMIEQPMLVIFFITSFLLNIIYIGTADLDQGYLQFIQNKEPQMGSMINESFQQQLLEQPSNGYQQRLLTDLSETENVFENYSTDQLAEEVIAFFQINDSVAEEIRSKYQKLTLVVDQLAEEEADLQIGAAGETTRFFTFIRNRIFHAILGESLVFAVLLGLFGSTSERFTRTDKLVFSSKTGRSVQISKYIASLIWTLLFYLLMSGLVFSLLSYTNPFGSLWQTSMSTQFHVNIYSPFFVIPFMTWLPMTLWNYTLLSLLLGLLLLEICHGISFLTGLWTNHFFRGFVLLVVLYTILAGMEQVTQQLGWSNVYGLLMWQPISLWNNQGYWFTEMGPYSTIPWQETLASLMNVGLLLIAGIFTGKYYPRKEVR